MRNFNPGRRSQPVKEGPRRPADIRECLNQEGWRLVHIKREIWLLALALLFGVYVIVDGAFMVIGAFR
jgi:hypothetical protein